MLPNGNSEKTLKVGLEFTADTKQAASAVSQLNAEVKSLNSAMADAAEIKQRMVASGYGEAAADPAAGAADADAKETGSLARLAKFAGVATAVGSVMSSLSKGMLDVIANGTSVTSVLESVAKDLPVIGDTLGKFIDFGKFIVTFPQMIRDAMKEQERLRKEYIDAAKKHAEEEKRDGLRSLTERMEQARGQTFVTRAAGSEATGRLGGGLVGGGLMSAGIESIDPRQRQAEQALRVAQAQEMESRAAMERQLSIEREATGTADKRLAEGQRSQRDADSSKKWQADHSTWLTAGAEMIVASPAADAAKKFGQEAKQKNLEFLEAEKRSIAEIQRSTEKRLEFEKAMAETAAKRLDLQRAELTIIKEKESAAKGEESQFGNMAFGDQLAVRNSLKQAKEEGWSSLSKAQRGLLGNTGLTADYANRQSFEAAQDNPFVDEIAKMVGKDRAKNLADKRVNLEQNVEVTVLTNEEKLATAIASALEKSLTKLTERFGVIVDEKVKIAVEDSKKIQANLKAKEN